MKMNEKILACRRRAGLSQEALAERLEVSRQAVSRWECGEATPEPAKILQLARTFGVTADWLLDDEMGEWAEEKVEPVDAPATHAQTLDDPPQVAGGEVDRPSVEQQRTGVLAVVIIALVALLYLALFSGIFSSLVGTRLFNVLFTVLSVVIGLALLVIAIVQAVKKR